MKMEAAKKPLVVGVYARNDPRLANLLSPLVDALNRNKGINAAPVHMLAGKDKDCCTNVVRRELRNTDVGAIISLEAGNELRVYFNGDPAPALFAGGAMAGLLKAEGHSYPSKKYAISKSGQTLSALSAEIANVFSEFGLPAMGVRQMQSQIMFFRENCDPFPLEKRLEMALNPFFTFDVPNDHVRFMQAMEKLHTVCAKYDYPMLFVKNSGRQLVPALHIELPGPVLALGNALAGIIDAGVSKLLGTDGMAQRAQ